MPILEQRGQDGTDKNVSCWLPVSCALWDGITYGLGFGMVCTCTKTIIITAQSAHVHEDNIHYRSAYYLHNKTCFTINKTVLCCGGQFIRVW